MKNIKLTKSFVLLVAIAAMVLPLVSFAQEGHQVGEMSFQAGDADRIFREPDYSPDALNGYPKRKSRKTTPPLTL